MTDKKYEFVGSGLTTKERNWAEKRFREYESNYYINSFSDKQLLEELVFNESLLERYKKLIEELTKECEASKRKKKKGNETSEQDSGKTVIPAHIMDAIENLMKRILELKKILGLLQKEDINEAKAEKMKEKKFKAWKELNQATREAKCCHCGKMIRFQIRVDKYDVKEHPFFMDKYFFNVSAFRLYFAGKITKLELAKIMLGEETSRVDYIDWIIAELDSHPVFRALKAKFKK